MVSDYIAKGARIRAQWLVPRIVALAGVQLKFEATPRDVVGIVPLLNLSALLYVTAGIVALSTLRGVVALRATSGDQITVR